MSIKNRKEREREEKRLLILKAAKDIMNNEGIDKVSIRKVASMIDYSPTMIYHYFSNKDEIINELMKVGYMELLSTLQFNQNSQLSSTEQFKDNLKRYINRAIQKSDEYKNILLNDSNTILNHTSVLDKGSSEKRPAIKLLCDFINECHQETINPDEVELTAQVIWSSMFGLILRIIIEDPSDRQKDRLIETFLNYTISCLKNNN